MLAISSDNQRDASIEDQLRICREKGRAREVDDRQTYKDAGISGASMNFAAGHPDALAGSLSGNNSTSCWRKR